MLDAVVAWQFPPQMCDLTPDAVHVWLTDLEDMAPYWKPLAPILGVEERERAASFHFEHDRQRYVSAHVVLRLLLGAYLGLAPERLTFHVGQYGKPRLATSSSSASPAPSLRFNLSHSHGMAIYALALGWEVGVDVEHMKRLPDWEHIAVSVFSPREQEALRSLPAHERQRAFYVCWARKEALIKATGHGLHMPLDQFDVSLAPHEHARLLDVRGVPATVLDTARWNLCDLPSIPRYAAALAIERHHCTVTCWRWTPGRFGIVEGIPMQ